MASTNWHKAFIESIPPEHWELLFGLDPIPNPPDGYKNHLADVYVMTAGNAVKVGLSSNVASRAIAMQTGNAQDVRIFWAVTLNRDNARKLEKLAHRELREVTGAAAKGEWFYIAPESAVSAIKSVIVREFFPCRRHPAYDFDRGLPEDASDAGFARMCSYY